MPVDRDASVDPNLVLHAADQFPACAIRGNQASDRFAVLGDDEPFRIQMVQHGQALLLEFRGIHASYMLIEYDWSHIVTICYYDGSLGIGFAAV